jgi:outer membrane protein assembly factor BamB
MYGRNDDEFLACFDAGTGVEKWRLRVDANRSDNQGGGPRSTPTLDGDLVYGLGARGVLVAARAATGESVWRKDLKKELGARVPQWGVSASPVVEGDLLLLDAGGRSDSSVAALDKKTGRTRWTAFSDKPGYSTALPVDIHGVRQVLFFTGRNLVSVTPDNGKVLWRVNWKTDWDVNAGMPIFVAPDKVFVSTAYDVGAALFQVARDGDSWTTREIWRSKVMRNHFNSSILHDGHLYGFDNATLKCIDAQTGEEKWAQDGFRKGSLILADGHLIVLSEGGLLALAEATPSAYKEKARVQALKGRTWTMPSLSDGILYLRNQKELVALDLTDGSVHHDPA